MCHYMGIQPQKFVVTLGNYWGFCQGKSVFSLICVSKLLLRHTILQNIYVNFWIEVPHFYTFSKQTPIIAVINLWKAVIQRCSANKVFWKILQNSQENTFAGVSFSWSFRPWDLQLSWKVTPTKVFFCEFCKVFEKPIL